MSKFQWLVVILLGLLTVCVFGAVGVLLFERSPVSQRVIAFLLTPTPPSPIAPTDAVVPTITYTPTLTRYPSQTPLPIPTSTRVLSPVPSRTFPTSVPRCEIEEYIFRTGFLYQKFNDALQRAVVTPRISLSEVIAEMQAARLLWRELRPPVCALQYHQAMLEAMDASIDATLAFLGQASDAELEVKYAESTRKMQNANEEFQSLLRLRNSD